MKKCNFFKRFALSSSAVLDEKPRKLSAMKRRLGLHYSVSKETIGKPGRAMPRYQSGLERPGPRRDQWTNASSNRLLPITRLIACASGGAVGASDRGKADQNRTRSGKRPPDPAGPLFRARAGRGVRRLDRWDDPEPMRLRGILIGSNSLRRRRAVEKSPTVRGKHLTRRGEAGPAHFCRSC